ncbi:polysaccharide deacetylase family protein [Pectinatus frisingensis]|uniref:polysaccharide deacetylase family protein n=1 Tax=Pectinatus frisingensis TaxID=865 RepID=UPI001E304F30|nr:polysaccharide deacetylase family protein [Pectinatus frisingensis]
MIFFLILLFIILTVICFIARSAHYIPVLMYHRIADVKNDRNSLSVKKFAWQLNYLHKKNYHTITLNMLYDFYAIRKKLPSKSILLTFDDGYADNYTAALPLLVKYKMTAVVFPIGNWIGKKNNWENFGKEKTITMTKEQLLDWQQHGQLIASHTMTHPFLTNCTESKIIDELHDSRQLLSNALSANGDFLCYPYGNFNESVAAAAKKTGYKAAFAIFEGVNLFHIDLYALPRIPIPSHQSKWEFILKTSRLFILFIALRKWERGFKKWRRKR